MRKTFFLNFQMEQSRLVYESATNQLGSFLEMVSTKLNQTKPNQDAATTDLSMEENLVRRRSRHSRSDIGQQSNLNRRSKLSLPPSTYNSYSEKIPHQRRDNESSHFSRSTSFASSSLDGSYQSDGNPTTSNRTDAKELETVNERHNKTCLSIDLADDNECSIIGEEVLKYPTTCDSSIISSCLGGADEKPMRQKSKTRKAIGRITSFIRKDKSRNIDLDSNSDKPSHKYSRYQAISGY